MKKRIFLLIIVALTSLLVTTTLLWIFERDNEGIRGFGDIVWWWVVTSATVGYGDIVPVTWQGRLVVVAMGSRDLIRSVLRDRTLDPLAWIRASAD